MCGIVATASVRPGADPVLLDRMRCTMHHRGPDDAGGWWSPDGRVGFGHQRLAIVDLSPGGHQPMASADGALHVTFNGEIYNYRERRDELAAAGSTFRTQSDTEVLLESFRRWGVECFRRLRGQFPLALHDVRGNRVILARDRAGEKPLFYRHAGDRITAASELKALFADPGQPRRIDRAALEQYLAYGYVPAPGCIIDGISKLMPGHYGEFDLASGRFATHAYWSLPAEPAASAGSVDALVDELETRLAAAVTEQLNADVPVGVLLSGGIDSSLVTAFASRAHRAIKTFTVAFPGHGEFDESAHARLVARHFGTDHHELEAEPATVDLLPVLARQYDEPLADSSMVPTYLVSRLVRQHATVALGGDGGDELFGGYTPYAWLLRQERMRRVVPRPVRAAAGALARLTPPGIRGRNYLLGFGSDFSDSIAHFRLFFEAGWRRRLLGGNGGPAPAPEAIRGGVTPPTMSPLRRLTATDFLTYMPDDILVKVDRASMLTSLEVRAPWLDHRLVEFAFSRVPDAQRATPDACKILPRRLAARVLPPGLDLARKQGFTMPLGAWFRGSWGSFFGEVLLDHGSMFDRGAVSRLLAGQRHGFSNTHRLFALTMFELWRREYGAAL